MGSPGPGRHGDVAACAQASGLDFPSKGLRFGDFLVSTPLRSQFSFVSGIEGLVWVREWFFFRGNSFAAYNWQKRRVAEAFAATKVAWSKPSFPALLH
jgi:hypothetical protein